MSNALRSQIYRLPADQHAAGACSICRTIAVLRFRDASTSWLICEQCVPDAIRAEKELLAAGLAYPSKTTPNR